MYSFKTLNVTLTPPFAFVVLNRPAVKNAMNNQMIAELIACFGALRDRRDVRAVVLSGAEGTFCAGGDIKEMAESGTADNFSGTLDMMLRTINEAPQVVVARVEGAAMGGGLGIVCVSDIAVARADALFALPEVRLGLAPAIISPYVIERVGVTRARELMLTGRRFRGDEAQKYGLVHDVCLPNDIDDHMNMLLEQLKQCSPSAIAACKQLIFAVKDKPLTETVDYRTKLLTELRQSVDGQEGMLAFVTKRLPQWTEDN